MSINKLHNTKFETYIKIRIKFNSINSFQFAVYIPVRIT